MAITEEELSKRLREVMDKFESQFKKCPDDIKGQLPEFIDILKKQSQIFQNRSEDFPKFSLTDARHIVYYNLSLSIDSIIRSAEWVIKNPEIGHFYDSFLYDFGSLIKKIKKDLKEIENLDSDWEKYFTYMDKIYSFYDKLDKLENIHEKVAEEEKKSEERKKKFEEEHYLDTIDEQLQNQYVSKFAEKIKEIIEKSAPDEIKTYSLCFLDDRSHFLMMKGKYPILYMIRHSYNRDYIVEGADYSITIGSEPEVSFDGDYRTLKELVDLIPEKIEDAPDGYGINIIPNYQKRGLTAKGLDLALFSMNDFDWKK